jgi:hypothetical protein
MRFVSLGFATLASGKDVTGSGSFIYDNKGYYLMIKSYSSIVLLLLNLQPKSNSTRVSVGLYTTALPASLVSLS